MVDLEDLCNGPTCDKLEWCTKENLKLIAERFDIIIIKQGKKQVIKDQLLSALVEQGLLSAGVGVVTSPKSEAGFTEQVRLRELELEMHRLDLKEKEIDRGFEVRKLEEETKRAFKGVKAWCSRVFTGFTAFSWAVT